MLSYLQLQGATPVDRPAHGQIVYIPIQLHQTWTDALITTPKEFFDPLTTQFMWDPCDTPCGHTFDRSTVSHVKRTGCIVCGRAIPNNCVFMPNAKMKQRIKEHQNQIRTATPLPI